MALPHQRYQFPGLWLALFAWSLASQAAAPRAAGHLVRGPYVQRATPHSICVVWRTDAAIKPTVRFGADSAQLDRQAAGADIRVRQNEGLAAEKAYPGSLDSARLGGIPTVGFQYEADLTGLEPDRQYYYAIYDGGTRLAGGDENHRFKTHPLPGANQPLRFWVVGDSGTGRPNQIQVYGAMTSFTARENHRPDFYLHVGDIAYSRGRDKEFQAHYFDIYGATLRHTVCWAAMGNHEGYSAKGTLGTGVGPYFDAFVPPMNGEAGGVPSQTESYYSFDWGRVRFLCLNSHDEDRKPTGRMARWMRADLAQAKAGGKTDWLVAFFHHAPYTKGTHDSDKEKALVEVRQFLMPILEAGGVDLVLTGHSHNYERSMLMDGAYDAKTTAAQVILNDGDGDPQGDGAYRKSGGIQPHQGTVQVVTGHGGTTIGRKGTMPVMRTIAVEHGSTLVDINGDTLTAIMLNRAGEVRDRFSLVKRGQVEVQRLASPWQPPVWKPSATAGSTPAAEPPEDYVVLIPPNAPWRYLPGPPANPNWVRMDFDDRSWKVGPTAIGYGYPQCRTWLPDMPTNYTTILLRHGFEVEQPDAIAELGLMINFDDAFLVYLNGHEVARVNVGKGRGASASGVKSHEARKLEYDYYRLKDLEKHLQAGHNVLAIEGHNVKSDSSDFLLDPWLVMED